MKFNNEGSYIISGDDGGVIKYWNSGLSCDNEMRSDGEAITGPASTRDNAVLSIAVAPGDRKFVSSTVDGTVRVWDFVSRRVDSTLRGHSGDVMSVSWHPSLALIASGGKDATVRLWDAASARELRVLSHHTKDVSSVAFSPINANWLLTGGRDNTVRLSDLRNLKTPVESWAVEHKGVTTLSWHPFVERSFVVGSNDGAIHWMLQGKPYAHATVPHAHDGSIWGLAFSPSAGALVSISQDQTAKFWVRARPGDMAAQNAYQGNTSKGYAENGNLLSLPGSVTAGVPCVQAPAPVVEDGADGVTSTMGVRHLGGGRRPPSSDYICHACRQPGHWRDECTSAGAGGGAGAGGAGAHGAQRGPPPASYVCRKCNQPGHYIQECPRDAGRRGQNGGGVGGGGGGGGG